MGNSRMNAQLWKWLEQNNGCEIEDKCDGFISREKKIFMPKSF